MTERPQYSRYAEATLLAVKPIVIGFLVKTLVILWVGIKDLLGPSVSSIGYRG